MTPKAPFADCDNCPLYDRPCVPSHLPVNARLLVVGEAPGSEEVNQGVPFVGDAGKVLDHALRFAGLPPEQVARTNAVLCRPEGNATPDDTAIDACSKRLKHDIAQAGVNTVLALGNTALQALDSLQIEQSIIDGKPQMGYSGGVMSRRGAWYPLGKGSYLAALHPAAVLYKPDNAQAFIADVQKAVAAVKGAKRQPYQPTKLQYIICDAGNLVKTLEYVKRIPSDAVVAFDVETGGFSFYDTPSTDKAEFLALGISYQQYRSVVFPIEMLQRLDVLMVLQDLFNRCKPLAHNAKFDQQHCYNIGLSIPKVAHDSMLASYVLDEVGMHGLKPLTASKLDCTDDYEYRLVTSWFEEQKIKKEDRNYAMVPKDRLYEYLAIDANTTLALHQALAPELEAQQLTEWPYTNVLIRASNAITQVELNGIMIDVPYLQKLRGYTSKRITEHLAMLQAQVTERVKQWLQEGKIVVPIAPWIKTRETYAKCLQRLRDDFNPGSWQQVQVYLYDVLKLTHTGKLSYKADPRSTAEENLLSLRPNDTTGFITALIEYRRLLKIQATYIDNLLRLADVDDRVHINFKLHGTEVGRLSAADGLHGIPRPSDVYGKAIRGSFIAPKGKKLVAPDYSQAELRVFAAESKEPTMLEPYRAGADLHDETAVMIAEPLADYFKHHFLVDHDGDWEATKQCTTCKEIRTLAKNVNFGEIYQGGPSGIASMLGGVIPLGVIALVLRIKREKQTVAASWKAQQLRTARAQGYVQSRFGYRRRFPIITDDNLDEVKKAAVHMPIANGAAVLTLLAICELVEAGIKVCGTWHDSIIAEADEADAPRVAALMADVMVRLGELYYPELPFKVDCDISDRWYSSPPDLDALEA